IRTWNPTTTAALGKTTCLQDRPDFAQFSAAGRRLLVTLVDAIEVWDTVPPRRVAQRKVRLGGWMPCLSPDGNKVLFREPASGQFMLWDLPSDTVVDISTPTSERIRHAGFSPDEQRLAVSLMRGETASVVEIWDLGNKSERFRLPGSLGVVRV